MDERKLYPKIMGIEEERKKKVRTIAKIPKCLRLSTSGGRCGNCGHETMEGHEDGHGIWHYRCIYCVTHQKPSSDPCPRCRCTAHERFGEPDEKVSPFKPKLTAFRCLQCGYMWNTPEYEKYLLVKAVRSVSSTSEFSENHNV